MTDHGNYWIFRIDPSGVPTPFLDGAAHGLLVPAGIELDQAGNLFVAGYYADFVARIRIDTAEFEVFSADPLLVKPNDLTMSPDGKGLVCACDGTSALVRLDPLGDATLLAQDYAYGAFLGAAIPGAYPGCSGAMTPFGTGTAGSGGFVPRVGGIYSPAPGADLGYVVDRMNGGSIGLFLWSLGQANLPIWGGTLYVDFATVWGMFPFSTSGAGPGDGEARFAFEHPDDPALIGLDVYVQVISADAGNPYRKALSNALEVSFGSW